MHQKIFNISTSLLQKNSYTILGMCFSDRANKTLH